jgi:four helix bundle protein
MDHEKFSFENLDVWKRAVEFVKIVTELTEAINAKRKHFRLTEQLESAVASVALNIAEGSGRYSRKEFIRFLYVARGSLYETVTLLTIFKSNDWITDQQFVHIKDLSHILARMLSGLINSLKLRTMNNEL